MIKFGSVCSKAILSVLLLTLLAPALRAQKEEPVEPLSPARLVNASIRTNGSFAFEIAQPTNIVYEVHSGNLTTAWTNIALLHGPVPWALPVIDFLRYVDPDAGHTRRFYRVAAREKTPTDDWKNQIIHAEEPFARNTSDFSHLSPRWVKFTILTNDPTRVYFQDSFEYAFHYEFAKARLPAFANFTPAQFDAISLHPTNQQVILGAVLLPPRQGANEMAIQLAGAEPYSRETVTRVFAVVEAAVYSPEPLQKFYFPTFEQHQSALQHTDYFKSKGIEVGTIDRWIEGNIAYSQGWGVGRLVFIPGAEIQAAYLDGRLKPSDILITDGVPAEVPYVSGIISLSPATPNSHVALLAQSQNVPFIYIADPAERAAITNLIGRDIALGSNPNNPFKTFEALDLTQFDLTVKSTLLALKEPEPLQYTAKVAHANYTLSVDALTPADSKFVGGKAANFGTLRRSLPTNSPPAWAITFRLWNEFMSQPSTGGLTLEQRIQTILAPFTNYPPDMGKLSVALAEIRDLIEDSTTFTATQVAAIEQALMVFDPRRKIRFRSSTNVEDTETFIGAGLYDSYSGCLADDQDADTTGPSICDSTEARERGVYRAIRKVFASFYNDNAFLERLRRKVKENEVGMAVLVHYSVPDEIELANGVATLKIFPGNPIESETKMVTQKGAVSVTNPEGNARPEVVEFSRWGTTTTLQSSTLVPIGASVLTGAGDYEKFNEFFKTAALEHKRVTGKSSFTLDFEYKKIDLTNGQSWLAVKQVREVPTVSEQRQPAYLLSPPIDFVVHQGEAGDVFGIHRLKSEFRLSANFTRLTTNLTSSLYGDSRYAVSNLLETNILTGLPSSWPGATFQGDELSSETRDSWRVNGPDGERRLTLMTTFFDSMVRADQLPIRTFADAYIQLVGQYTTPQPSLDWSNDPTTVTNEIVRLAPRLFPSAGDTRQTRTVIWTGAKVTTSFDWPPHPGGVTVGYTAPLVQFAGTTIEGLTTQSLNLTGYYAQSYRPGHHNFTEDFIFEPQLEPGLSVEALAELRAKNIKQIYVHWGGQDGHNVVYAIGFDKSMRALLAPPQQFE